MTEAEFKKRRHEIYEEISKLEQERNEMDRAYIEEHKPFNVGDKIKVTGKWIRGSCLAYVIGFRLGYDLEIEPVLKKVKKDGTMSCMGLYLYGSEQFELVEPINNL